MASIEVLNPETGRLLRYPEVRAAVYRVLDRGDDTPETVVVDGRAIVVREVHP